jgi:hypothetical protein
MEQANLNNVYRDIMLLADSDRHQLYHLMEKELYQNKRWICFNTKRSKNSVKNQEISSFKTALQETKMMSADIVQNGIEGYKTLDDLLNED